VSDLDKAIREAAYTVDRNKLHAVDVLWDPIAEGEAYLCRLANGMWEWFDSPDDRHGVRVDSTWEVAMQEADGPLTEVVSPEGTS
jgi:hypothetical protein